MISCHLLPLSKLKEILIGFEIETVDRWSRKGRVAGNSAPLYKINTEIIGGFIEIQNNDVLRSTPISTVNPTWKD
jgi:hypothetical protein